MSVSEYAFTKRLRSVSDRDVMRLQELFLDPAHAFDAEKMDDYLLFPLEMTWFYGEPIYEQMPEAQKLMVNRLTFCQNYLSTLVAEAASNILNYESTHAELLRGDPEVAFYMAREVIEETFHLEAFYIVLSKVLQHYGISFEECRRKNRSLRAASFYTLFHSIIGGVRGDYNYYYLTRFPLNIVQKTIERSTIDEPRMHPLVRDILKNHSIDEARHMRMSREAGKLALKRIRPGVMRNASCFFYAHFAARLNTGGRHAADGLLSRDETRISVLELCGIPRPQAVRAYKEWRKGVNQPADPPHLQRARLYFTRLNFSYIDELDVSERMKAYMKRVIGAPYQEVIRAAQDGSLQPLEFGELHRSS